jgi:chromosome segregation ATPase
MELGASRQARHPEQSTRRDGRGGASDATGAATTERASEAGITDSDRHPGLVDATRYDLDRLERAIRQVLAQQQRLVDENESLRRRLQGRDAEVERLESELAASRQRREQALKRVDALIAELDRLDGLLDSSMAEWRARADATAPDSGGAAGSPG